jgi:hypothetical protein
MHASIENHAAVCTTLTATSAAPRSSSDRTPSTSMVHTPGLRESGTGAGVLHRPGSRCQVSWSMTPSAPERELLLGENAFRGLGGRTVRWTESIPRAGVRAGPVLGVSHIGR